MPRSATDKDHRGCYKSSRNLSGLDGEQDMRSASQRGLAGSTDRQTLRGWARGGGGLGGPRNPVCMPASPAHSKALVSAVEQERGSVKGVATGLLIRWVSHDRLMGENPYPSNQDQDTPPRCNGGVHPHLLDTPKDVQTAPPDFLPSTLQLVGAQTPGLALTGLGENMR